MTRAKQVKAYAKSLIKLCSENGSFSEERALAVLQALEKNPPRHYVAVLKAFLRLAQVEIAASTADVEHAGELSSAAIANIQRKFAAAYGREIAVKSRQNDALIAGVRVRVGCDVYESSIAASLQELQSSLS